MSDLSSDHEKELLHLVRAWRDDGVTPAEAVGILSMVKLRIEMMYADEVRLLAIERAKERKDEAADHE